MKMFRQCVLFLDSETIDEFKRRQINISEFTRAAMREHLGKDKQPTKTPEEIYIETERRKSDIAADAYAQEITINKLAPLKAEYRIVMDMLDKLPKDDKQRKSLEEHAAALKAEMREIASIELVKK